MNARARCRSIVLAISLAALAACSTVPPYQRPVVTAADAWHQPASAPASDSPSANWWNAFQSSQLDALVEQARRANLDLAAATARIHEADAQIRIAGGALLPSLSLGSDVSRQRQPRARSNAGAKPTATLQQASLSASYEIDFWGKNRAAVTSARESAAASKYDRDTVELSITSAVATTYFQVLALRDRVSVAKDNLANADRVLDILHARLAAGIATALDVAQQETLVATLKASVPPLQAQLQQEIDALAILLGTTPEAFDITNGALADLTVPEIAAGIPSELLVRRPDIAEAEAQLRAANADIAAARAAFFPSFQLTVQGGFESAALVSSLGPASALFTLAAGVTQPIFEGGRLQGQYGAARARYDELLQNYRKSVISSFADVEDALASTRHTAEQETEQLQAVAAARRAHDIALAQLHAGTADLLTVLTAQNALFSAEDTLLEVKLARLQASVSLFKALGGGWREPQEITS